MSETSSDFQRLGEAVHQVHAVSSNLSSQASEAFRRALEVQESVAEASRAIRETGESVVRLRGDSEQIQQVVELLRTIVDSTHVLGINASILAARAGSAGRGFDVISQEIRRLAEQSTGSLGRISAIVAEVSGRIVTLADQVELTAQITQKEHQALLAVAGSLQGTVLGVEVIHEVSRNAIVLGQSLEGRCLDAPETPGKEGATPQRVGRPGEAEFTDPTPSPKT